MSLIAAHAGMMVQQAGEDPYFANVISLLHFEGSDASTTFTDQIAGRSWSVTSGAEIDTAQAKFGSASGLFPTGVNSNFGRIDSDTDADFALGTGDFTLEGWVRLDGTKSGFRFIGDFRPVGTSGGLYPSIYVNGTTLIFLTNNIARITSASGVMVTTGSWQHWAISRVSGVTRMFVDGVQRGSSYTDSNSYIGSRCRYGQTGASNSTDNLIGGWLDDCRITKGVGRYSANFTPPTSAFPDS